MHKSLLFFLVITAVLAVAVPVASRAHRRYFDLPNNDTLSAKLSAHGIWLGSQLLVFGLPPLLTIPFQKSRRPRARWPLFEIALIAVIALCFYFRPTLPWVERLLDIMLLPSVIVAYATSHRALIGTSVQGTPVKASLASITCAAAAVSVSLLLWFELYFE